MMDDNNKQLHSIAKSVTRLIYVAISLIIASVLLILAVEYDLFKTTSDKTEKVEVPAIINEVKDGIHVQSGLIAADGYELVYQNCGGCHSHKLVVQNRATKQGWSDIIKWMQKSHNLWDLGENEVKIIQYLSTNYAPQSEGRRKNLNVADWYILED